MRLPAPEHSYRKHGSHTIIMSHNGDDIAGIREQGDGTYTAVLLFLPREHDYHSLDGFETSGNARSFIDFEYKRLLKSARQNGNTGRE